MDDTSMIQRDARLIILRALRFTPGAMRDRCA